MSSILSNIAPVLALIAIGYGIARTPKWTPAVTGDFNNFVFYVALPTLIFGKLASGGGLEGVESLIIAAYFGGSLISTLILMVFSRLVFEVSGEELAVIGMSAGFSNTVLLESPMILLTFGDFVLGTIAMMIAVNTLLLLPTTIILVEVSQGRRSEKSII